MKKTIIGLLTGAVIIINGIAVAGEFGPVSGEWESSGHWRSAGRLGVVCEERPGKAKPVKVKLYQRVSNYYQEYEKFRFYPDNNCSEVTKEQIMREFGKNFSQFFSLEEDTFFIPEGGKKRTMRRWFIYKLN